MGSMLVSYYLYSKYVIGYYYSKIVWFWIIMLFITAIIGNIFYKVRNTKLFRIEIILSIIGYIIINKESNKKNREGNENNESGF